LELETRKLQAEMTRVQDDSKKLASDYIERKVELEKRTAEVAETVRREAEGAEEKHQRQSPDSRARGPPPVHHGIKFRGGHQAPALRPSELQRQWKPRRGFFGNIGHALDAVSFCSKCTMMADDGGLVEQ
jgi:hypothetical protein